jgi:hypothetical protein
MTPGDSWLDEAFQAVASPDGPHHALRNCDHDRPRFHWLTMRENVRIGIG